jgi:hypothetical protein
MFPTAMLRTMGVGIALLSAVALAQNERVVEVPWPPEADAGIQETPDITPKTVVLPAEPPPMPPPAEAGEPPPIPPSEVPVDAGGPRTIEAMPPPPPPPEQLDENPRQAPPPGTRARAPSCPGRAASPSSSITR